MNTAIPDNAINEELFSRLNNLDVNGTTFKCYIAHTGASNPENYYLIATQLNQSDPTKCGVGRTNSTEIQVIVRLPKNKGSKTLLNEATEALRQETEDFSLPPSTGFVVNSSTFDVENELIEDIDSEIVYRKIVRLETTIN